MGTAIRADGRAGLTAESWAGRSVAGEPDGPTGRGQQGVSGRGRRGPCGPVGGGNGQLVMWGAVAIWHGLQIRYGKYSHLW